MIRKILNIKLLKYQKNRMNKNPNILKLQLPKKFHSVIVGKEGSTIKKLQVNYHNNNK